MNPPALTITAPGSNTVDQPLLQLQGFAPVELASVTYDVSNSVGWTSNQAAVILTRYFDTNLWWFTTNGFQAFDVGLTVGANHITLHAQDLAGNMTTSNYTFTLDYSSKTNPPVVGLYWPTNGSVICGTNFGWRGWVADPTVMVSAQIVDSSGDTNVVNGIVERNGNFWIDNLPLASGTNSLTLTATDAVGNVATTNISVVQSHVNMSFTSIPDVSNQTFVTVGGTLDTSGYRVWVNGVLATQSGTAPSITWEAVNVPVPGIGTTVFEALAIANTDNGGNGTGGGGGTNTTLSNPGNPTPADLASPRLSTDPDKQSCMICEKFNAAMDWLWTDANANVSHHFDTVDFTYDNAGSSLSTYYQSYWTDFHGFEATTASWDPFGDGDVIDYSADDDGDYGDPETVSSGEILIMDSPDFEIWPPPFDGPVPAHGEESDYNVTSAGWNTSDFIYPDYTEFYPATLSINRKVASLYSLRTGGKAASQRQAVFQLAVGATSWANLPTPTSQTVPSSQITVFGKPLGNDGNYFVVEPDGITIGVPVDVPGSTFFTFGVTEGKYPVVIKATTNNNTITLDPNTASTFCVGQNIQFTLVDSSVPCLPDMQHGGPSYGNWNLPDKFVNEQWQLTTPPNDGWPPRPPEGVPYGSVNYRIDAKLLNNCLSTSCWYVNTPGGTVGCSGRLYFENGQNVAVAAVGKISIYRPTITFTNLPGFVGPYFTIKPELFGTCRLKLGDDDGNGDMDVGAVIHSRYSGSIGITQLITADDSNPAFQWSEEECDGKEFYVDPQNVLGLNNPTAFSGETVIPGDGPSNIWPSQNILDNSARDFVRFQPNGGIWVTLGIIYWDIHAKAVWNPSTSSWSLASQEIWGPEGPDDSDELPVWTTIIPNSLGQ